jgi:hypothetical protein
LLALKPRRGSEFRAFLGKKKTKQFSVGKNKAIHLSRDFGPLNSAMLGISNLEELPKHSPATTKSTLPQRLSADTILLDEATPDRNLS